MKIRMLTSRVENDGSLMAVHDVYDVPTALAERLIDAEQAEAVEDLGKSAGRRERAARRPPETRTTGER